MLSELDATGAESGHHIKRNVIQFRHLFKIDGFLTFNKPVISPEFASKEYPDPKWQLKVSKVDSFVRVDLNLISGKTDFEYRWEPFLCDDKGKEIDAKKNQSTFDARKSASLTFAEFIAIADLNDSSKGFLPNGTLRLVSQITMYTDSVNPVAVQLEPLHSTPEDFSKLYYTGRLTDVIFVVDNEEFKAHKAILALRSPVFAAMFEHQEMEENKRNRVVITDLDCNVFKEFLIFLYSNKSANIDIMAPELLAAADKYDIKNLKTMCESVLERDLTVERAIETLILADRYCAPQLKTRSFSIIKENISIIVSTTEWSHMIKNFPHLISEITLFNANK